MTAGKEAADANASSGGLADHASAIVDTNVMMEIFTFSDMDRAIRDYEAARGTEVDGPIDDPKVQQRRRFMCGSWWAALALDQLAFETLSLYAEIDRKSQQLVAPDSDGAIWPDFVSTFLYSAVCPGWISKMSDIDKDQTGTRCDRLIVAEAKRRRIPIISRDGGVHRKAKTDGVASYHPAGYAASVGLTREMARDRFFDRLRAADPSVLSKPLADELPVFIRTYEWIWSTPATDLDAA